MGDWNPACWKQCSFERRIARLALTTRVTESETFPKTQDNLQDLAWLFPIVIKLMIDGRYRPIEPIAKKGMNAESPTCQVDKDGSVSSIMICASQFQPTIPILLQLRRGNAYRS